MVGRMIAEEMFKKLGYACQKNDVAIIYRKCLSTCINEIVFQLDLKKYVAIEPLGGLFIDADTHKAITEQMEELGWLDE